MQIDQIITELAKTDCLPVDAITTASRMRPIAVPAFLREIEKYLAASTEHRVQPSPLFMIIHLLGAWREKAAYRPVASLFRLPTGNLESVLGDAITVTSHRIMAAIFDHDPRPLQAIILDAQADEFIRSRMCEAFAMVVLDGDLPAQEGLRFLRALFNDIIPRQANQVWFGWQNAIAMLGLEELRPQVEHVFDRGWIDAGLTSFEHFDDGLQLMRGRPDLRPPLNDEQYAPLGDVIAELSRWHHFTDLRR